MPPAIRVFTPVSSGAGDCQHPARRYVAAADEITVTATGNARSAFEAPMMVSVIDATAPENQTASSAADLLRKVPGLMLDGTGAHQRWGR